MTLRNRLVCFAEFAGLTLLAVLFLLPLLNWFFRVSLSTLFTAALNFFQQPTTSAFSGAAKSTKSARTRFAARTKYLRKNGITVLPVMSASKPNPGQCCRPKALGNGVSTCLEETIL